MNKKLLTIAALAIGTFGLTLALSPADAAVPSAGINIAESSKINGVIKVAQRHNRRSFRRSFRSNRRAFRRSFNRSRPVMRRSFRPNRRVVRRYTRPNRSYTRRYARPNRPYARRYTRRGRIWRNGPRYRFGGGYWPYGYYGAGLVSGLYLSSSYACDDYYYYALETGSSYWWDQYDICTGAY